MRRLAITGIPIDNVSMDEAVRTLDGYIQEGHFHQVATANINFLVNAMRDRELQEILQTCSLVLADGVPLTWAARLMQSPLKERVAGYDLVPRLAGLAAERNYGIYLLGASEECSAGAAEWIRKNHPGARIAGRYASPVAALEDMDHDDLLRRIEHAKPDILLVAFGNPKQEKWIRMHRHRLNVSVAIGVGGSLNFLAGKVKYAPRWMRRSGVEAIYRVWQEPRRLGGRYASDFFSACRYLPAQILAVRAQPWSDKRQQLVCFRSDGAWVLKPEGRFTGCLVGEFEVAAEKAGAESFLDVDLSATTVLGADALGALIRLKSYRFGTGVELSLSGVSGTARRVIEASGLAPTFIPRQLPPS